MANIDKTTQNKQINFYPCESCGGFGYEVTPAKTHVRCRRCQDNPSMYATIDSKTIFWGRGQSLERLRSQQVQEIFNLLVNGILLVASVITLIGFFAAYFFLAKDSTAWEFFSTPGKILALLWLGLLIALFLYYRLEQEHASHRRLSSRETAAKNAPKLPTVLNYDSLHQLRATKIDFAQFFTRESFKVISSAFNLAKKLSHHQVAPLHFFGALMETLPVRIILARLALEQKTIWDKLTSVIARSDYRTGDGLDLNRQSHELFFYAYQEALMSQRPSVDIPELLLALVKKYQEVKEIFFDLEVDEEMLTHVVEWIRMNDDLRRHYWRWRKKAGGKPKGIMDRAMTARPSPLLESMSQDYTAAARVGAFMPPIGRQAEMEQILRILRERTESVLLVGPAGAGKTTLFEGLANLMASEDVPPELRDKRLVVLDPGSLIAGAEGVGTLEGRMMRVMKEITRAGNIILGIEDIHHLLNMRSTGGTEDVANILMNGISRGMVKIVATSTTEDYQRIVSPHEAFLRRFQIVRVEEMTSEKAILVCEAKSGSLEYRHHVFFSYGAIVVAVEMTVRFMQDRHLPAKALDVLAEAAALAEATRGARTFVTKEDVAQVISEKTNVKVTTLTADERQKLLHLEEKMHERIVGQDFAVVAIASALRRAREGLREVKRPIASFLFIGPTGVGKTETAKTIAEVYFGEENNMVRVDMSEYQTLDSLRNLIGAKGEEGYFTEAVRNRPFSLVLLDEIEKAHPQILNIFLQILDDGRVTDGLGRVIDMTNTMIIATSNAANQAIRNGFNAGMSAPEIKQALLEETLLNFFRPEFLNRFDDVILFKPLTVEETVEIVRRMLNRVAQQVYDQKGLTLKFEDEVVLELVEKGYDEFYGARPLRRLIEQTVDDALAKLLLEEKVGRRDTVYLKKGGFLEIQKAAKL